MKPTRTQCFFASAWPERIWFAVVPMSLACWVCIDYISLLYPFSSLWDFLYLVWLIVLSLLLGLVLAIFPGGLAVGSLYHARELKNGGPFAEGDVVQILCGPHKGRISKVYSKWQGNTLRVELGDKEADDFKDIFSPVQLLRESGADPSHSVSG